MPPKNMPNRSIMKISAIITCAIVANGAGKGISEVKTHQINPNIKTKTNNVTSMLIILTPSQVADKAALPTDKLHPA